MRTHGRRDTNHASIRDGLRDCGWSVHDTGDVGDGLDLVVGAAGVTVLVEVKSAGGKLRPEQVEFIDGWRAPVVVAYSLEEAIRGIEAAIARAA